VTYDPAFSYELATIIRTGIRRMYVDREDVFYYLTVLNESYPMPPKPAGVEEGILKGMYRLSRSADGKAQVHLFGSGSILNEALKAQQILHEQYEVGADVWSVTSFKELHRDGVEVERWNLLHPEEEPRVPYLSQCLLGAEGAFVMASDYLKALPNSVARWFPRVPVALGTDGFGRSDSRGALRDFFEVDARYYVLGALSDLSRQGRMPGGRVAAARSALEIDPEKIDPVVQ
jgi:pyruvate dehydrogenase E1 component